MHLSSISTSTLQLIPDGVPGISATLKIMSQLVKEYKKSMAVRGLTLRLVKDCGQKDYSCEVRQVHAYVRDTIRYVNDIRDVETIQTPDKTIELGQGDCDDKSTLIAAMLESIGHPTRFVAIGFQVGVFAHVYVETKIGAKWIPLETTEPVDVGWEPDPQIIVERMQYYN